jgi:hypothetical protein
VPPGKLAEITGMLVSGEKVLWAGGPDALATLRTKAALWWVGVPWLLVVLVLIVAGLIPEGWRLIAVAPGLAFAAAPFVMAYLAGGTVYAITDRRVIVRLPSTKRGSVDIFDEQQSISLSFDALDEKTEILPTRTGFGHLYFASAFPRAARWSITPANWRFAISRSPTRLPRCCNRLSRSGNRGNQNTDKAPRERRPFYAKIGHNDPAGARRGQCDGALSRPRFPHVLIMKLETLRGDIYGGITVAVVALPLALAFGVASGIGPIAGLYGAIAVGFFAAIFGGTPSQVSGPTGPMTVVMAAIVAQHADRLETAFTIVFLGSLLQMLFDVARLGRYVTTRPIR